MKRKTEVDVYGKVRWESIEKVPIDGRLEERKFNRYGLTYQGQAICVDSYALDLTSAQSTHVLLV